MKRVYQHTNSHKYSNQQPIFYQSNKSVPAIINNPIFVPQHNGINQIIPPNSTQNQIRNVIWNNNVQQEQILVEQLDNINAVNELKQELQQYRSKYQQLVQQLKKKQIQSSNLSVLAQAYEQLQLEKNNLAELLKQNELQFNKLNEKLNNTNMIESQNQQLVNELKNRIEEYNQLNNYAGEMNQQLQRVTNQRDQMAQYIQDIQDQQKKLLQYQEYTKDLQSKFKQLIDQNQKNKLQKQELLQQLNNRMKSEQKVAMIQNVSKREKNNNNNSLAENFTNKSQKLQKSMSYESDSIPSTTFQKRLEILSLEIQRLNNTILNKNKQIYQLKNFNAQSDKLQKINIELQSTNYENQKLNNVLIQKNNQIASIRTALQILERKQSQFQSLSKQNPMIRQLSLQCQKIKDSLFTREIQLNKVKQQLEQKQKVLIALQSQKQEKSNKILILQSQIERHQEQNRYKTNLYDIKNLENEKKRKYIDIEQKECINRLESDINKLNNLIEIKQQKIKHLEATNLNLNKELQSQQKQLLNLKSTNENRYNELHYGKLELQNRLNNTLYDMKLRITQISRLQNQNKYLVNQLNEIKAQNLKNIKTISDYEILLQNKQLQFEMKLHQFKLQLENEKRKQIMQNTKLNKPKQSEPTKIQSAVVIQTDKNDNSYTDKNLTKLQIHSKINENQEKQFISQASSVLQKEFNRNTYDIDKKSEFQNKKRQSHKSVRKDNSDIQKILYQNQKLKEYVDDLKYTVSGYQQTQKNVRQLQIKINHFALRIEGILNQKQNVNVKIDKQKVTFKKILSELDSKIQKFKKQNQQLRIKLTKKFSMESKIKQCTHQNKRLREEYQYHQMEIQRYLQEIHHLKRIINQLTNRGNEYSSINSQKQSIYISNTIKQNQSMKQSLTEKVQFFKQKNTQLENRISQLLKINNDLKDQLEKGKVYSQNQKGYNYYQNQHENLMKNYELIKTKLNHYMQENVKLVAQNKQNISKSDLLNKITKLQNQILQLTNKITKLQTQKSYMQHERKQISAKSESYLSQLKKIKSLDEQTQKKITEYGNQLQNNEIQKQNMNKQLKALLQENQKLQMQIKMNNIKYYDIQQERETFKTEISKLTQNINSINHDNNNFKLTLNKYQAILKQIDNLLLNTDKTRNYILQLENKVSDIEFKYLHDTIYSGKMTEILTRMNIVFTDIEHIKQVINEKKKNITNIKNTNSNTNNISYSNNFNKFGG